jgi:hypothetical protein
MSAREIIAQIDALPPEEKAILFDYVRRAEAKCAAICGKKEIRYATESEFERVNDEVFTKHAPLLKKLAES